MTLIKRLTLLVSFVHTVATGVRDDVVTMFCKRMAAIHKRGRDHLEGLREAHRAESERLLGVFGDVLSAVRDALVPGDDNDPVADEASPESAAATPPHERAERAGHLVLKTLERAGGVEALVGAHEAISAHHGNNYLPLLEQYYRSHRAALFTLLEAIELEGHHGRTQRAGGGGVSACPARRQDGVRARRAHGGAARPRG